MASNSDNSHIEISIEKDSDKNKNKKILGIVCSPKLEHVAALHENNDITLWSIVSQEKLSTDGKPIHIDYIRTDEKIDAISDDKYISIRKIFAISDNKQVSISLDRIKPYNFKIFDFETPDKEIKLTFPDWQKEIDFLSFIENGNIIMINAKYYRAYVFSSKDNKGWACKSMIELQYFRKFYITPKGKLILFNDTINEITLWDLDDISAKARILLEWRHILIDIELSDDEELLAVLTENKNFNEKNLYVFSTETGINLSSFSTKLRIDRFHLIASSKGERLLYRYIHRSVEKYSLMDSYNLQNPISANKLFENKQTQEQYIIKSDKIIYTKDGKVLIENFVPDDWVEFLRKKLKDTNSITTPSEMTIDNITKIIMNGNYNTDEKEFDGKFLKWSLELNNESVKLTVYKLNTPIKKQLDILPSLKDINGNNFIIHCEVLENDDFVTITRIGVFIWAYKISDIKMHYYWNDCNDRLEDFAFEKTVFKNLFKDRKPGRILPASSYETILKNLDVKFGEKELFEEFLKSNVTDEFYITCYGKDFMKALIVQKDDKWIRNLGYGCAKLYLKDKNYLISKVSLLSIIFENFKELSENHPAFILSMLALIAFVVPCNVVYPESTSSHLSSYGRYYHLSKTSYLNILFPNLWVHCISFFKKWQKYFNQDNHNSTVLAIPLPNFVSYPKEYSFWKELLLPKNHSPFSHSKKFEMVDEEFYRYLNGEALLKFKWDTYGKKYYFAIWAIYTIFLGCFISISAFSNNISWFYQQILLYTVIILGFWHLFVEIRQLLIYSPVNYLSSSWNYLATISTTATSIYWLKNGSAPTWAITFSTLFLEIKFIIFFRPIKFFGIYLAMIMNTVDRVISFLIIFGFFTLAFAHSLYLLLRSASEASQDSSINMFEQFGSSIIASYYMMITGDTDPISFWISNENVVIMILMIIVSFFMLIYLMNLFIGILSDIVSNGNNDTAYLALKREIIIEIELLYMLPYQRRKENWFPFVIFYECDTVDLRLHVRDILKGKWPSYKEPYISNTLNEVLQLPEEPSLKQIKDNITAQELSIKDLPTKIEKVINDLATFKQIENDIKVLNEIKELIKSSENKIIA